MAKNSFVPPVIIYTCIKVQRRMWCKQCITFFLSRINLEIIKKRQFIARYHSFYMQHFHSSTRLFTMHHNAKSKMRIFLKLISTIIVHGKYKSLADQSTLNNKYGHFVFTRLPSFPLFFSSQFHSGKNNIYLTLYIIYL